MPHNSASMPISPHKPSFTDGANYPNPYFFPGSNLRTYRGRDLTFICFSPNSFGGLACNFYLRFSTCI